MVYSGATALITGNGAFVSEMLHDTGDTVAHTARYQAERRGIDQNTARFRRFRKVSFIILSGLSAATAAKIGWDLFANGVVEETLREEVLNITGGVVVAGGNVYAVSQTAAIEEHSLASHDSHSHAGTDAVASIGLAATIITEPVTWEGLSQVGGAGFAGYTALHMLIHGLRAGREESGVYCNHA